MFFQVEYEYRFDEVGEDEEEISLSSFKNLIVPESKRPGVFFPNLPNKGEKSTKSRPEANKSITEVKPTAEKTNKPKENLNLGEKLIQLQQNLEESKPKTTEAGKSGGVKSHVSFAKQPPSLNSRSSFKPIETKKGETKLQGTNAEKPKSRDSIPRITKPGKSKPDITKPRETKAGETKPQEINPQESKPGEEMQTEIKPKEVSGSEPEATTNITKGQMRPGVLRRPVKFGEKLVRTNNSRKLDDIRLKTPSVNKPKIFAFKPRVSTVKPVQNLPSEEPRTGHDLSKPGRHNLKLSLEKPETSGEPASSEKPTIPDGFNIQRQQERLLSKVGNKVYII